MKTKRKASQKFSRNRKKQEPSALFWKHVNKTETCWLWTGCGSGPNGDYGGFANRGIKVKAHRFSFEMEYGPISPEICVLHKCDTPRCVRPDHLFLGTRLDNALDCKAKKRQHIHVGTHYCPRGEDSHNSRFTDIQVFKLRRLRLKGVSFHRMGQWLGVHRATMRRIVVGESWAHVPMPLHEKQTYAEAIVLTL